MIRRSQFASEPQRFLASAILCGGLVMALALRVHAQDASPQESSGDKDSASIQEDFDRGVEALRKGKIQEALQRLDRVAEKSPASVPHLWQRGIAQYLAGEYKAGRLQFEQHRVVNPSDVENATWHFLCVAAEEGVDAARKAFLPAPQDSRVPQAEIYALYQGTGDREGIERAVAKLPEGSAARRTARFYADLYLGLYAHALGNKDEAKKYLDAAAAVTGMNVMGDVARVCRDTLPETAR